ncbi:MAG: exonuclease, partial [Minisyncoccia bacterium]
MGYDPNKKDSLDQWRKRIGKANADHITKTAGEYGNALHACAEYYLSNNDSMLELEKKNSNLIVRNMFSALKSKLDLYVDNIHALEVPLYSDILKTAGRTDCIALWNGELAIIDFKNSKKKKKREWIQNYVNQATCYAIMAEEFLGVLVTKIVIPICYYDGTIDIFVGDTKNHYSDMRGQIDFYYKNHPEMV